MIVSYSDKANVVSDALSRKKRVKSRRVRGMILATQNEAFKQENVLTERLHGLDQQMERKETRVCTLWIEFGFYWVLVTKPQNKTPYELLHGRTPSIGFMRPFGCLVTILNILDPLGKFKGKVDKGFLVGYSVNSKAFRVFNSRTHIVQETFYVNFLENKPNILGTGPTWLFDIDSLARTMNCQPVTTGNKSNPSAGFQEEFDAEKAEEEATQQYMFFPVWSTGSSNPQNKEGDAAFDGKEHDTEKPESVVNLSPSSSALSGEQDDMTKKKDKGKSLVEYFTGNRDFNADFEYYFEDNSNNVSAASPIVPTAGQNYSNNTIPISAPGPSNTNTSPTHGKSSLQDASQPPEMLEREDIAYSDHENVGAEADFNNLETSITEPKRVHQALKDPSWIEAMRNKKDERGIVVRNKVRLVAQGHTQEEGIYYEEVFAPVERIEAIRLFLAYASFMGFMVYQMDVKSAFLYGTIEEEVYVCQPPRFEDPDHPDKVYKVVKAFMVYIRLLELGKLASTPIDTEKSLLKDPDGEDVDEHIYRIFRYLKGKPYLGLWYLKDSPFDLVAYSDSDYAGASLDRKSTSGGCQFFKSRLISWQCKKQTVVATSSIEAEYVAGANCCAQVLWIQNQMLDYGVFNSPMLYVLRVEMVINSPWMLSKKLASPEANGFWQFWNTAVVKRSGDVTRLQALVDKKRIVISEEVVLDKCSALVLRVEGLETANVAQQLEIIKLKARVKKLERLNKGRISVDMETDEGIELEVAAASTSIPAAKPKVLKIAAAPAVSTRKRKGVVIRDPEEELHTGTPAETSTVKDKGKGILIEDPKPM
nr:hypothetical protein [Tanacetum cinerariifolium]